MYKYNPCACHSIVNVQSLPYVKPIVGRGNSLPESARVAAETCSNVVVDHVQITVVPNTPIPPVPVRTVPASNTTAAAAQAVILQETNPYVPATRFSQYFPAPPLLYVVPRTMRVPNNDPKPSTRECIPNRRFQSTAESLKNS
jgi:hypothetical protein